MYEMIIDVLRGGLLSPGALNSFPELASIVAMSKNIFSLLKLSNCFPDVYKVSQANVQLKNKIKAVRDWRCSDYQNVFHAPWFFDLFCW